MSRKICLDSVLEKIQAHREYIPGCIFDAMDEYVNNNNIKNLTIDDVIYVLRMNGWASYHEKRGLIYHMYTGR